MKVSDKSIFSTKSVEVNETGSSVQNSSLLAGINGTNFSMISFFLVGGIPLFDIIMSGS